MNEKVARGGAEGVSGAPNGRRPEATGECENTTVWKECATGVSVCVDSHCGCGAGREVDRGGSVGSPAAVR